jgi:hypothetical protein
LTRSGDTTSGAPEAEPSISRHTFITFCRARRGWEERGPPPSNTTFKGREHGLKLYQLRPHSQTQTKIKE